MGAPLHAPHCYPWDLHELYGVDHGELHPHTPQIHVVRPKHALLWANQVDGDARVRPHLEHGCTIACPTLLYPWDLHELYGVDHGELHPDKKYRVLGQNMPSFGQIK